ncbi:MAG: hypothetical protein KBT69_06615 [Oceanihabitans sp.]|nr:hypothetical protein [Oceanihabitans sp.]
MKIIEMNIWILLFALIQIKGYAQSEKDTINNVIIVPLKVGKNPNIHLETLEIEPTNLFIQSKPTHKNAPHIQLALNIMENNKKHTTYLWFKDDATDNPKTNYPKAFGNYVFNLKIHKEDVALVIEKLDFESAFFMDIGQTVVIENMSILFDQCIGEWSEDINGNQIAAFNTYSVLLSEEKEQKTFSFTSLNDPTKSELSIAWKNYKILVLEDSEKALKLIVFKKD